jgi:NAD(P)-dependent dehydrogenase (short-subunit alcohol dehydrogenase family)
VVGATKVTARERSAKGVRINSVCPAVIRTDMADDAFFRDPEVAEGVVAMHPIGRVGTPDDVARAVVWLCSDDAFVTGVAFPIDGGLLS